LRALESPPAIHNRESGRRIHSRFQGTSPECGGRSLIEIIDLTQSLFISTSRDFNNAGLGTCHRSITESVQMHLRKRFPNFEKLREEEIESIHSALEMGAIATKTP
jgi:hypothetical protein